MRYAGIFSLANHGDSLKEYHGNSWKHGMSKNGEFMGNSWLEHGMFMGNSCLFSRDIMGISWGYKNRKKCQKMG